MAQKYIWSSVIVVALVLSGWYFFEKRSEEMADSTTENGENSYLEEGPFMVEEEGVGQSGAVVASGTANQSSRYTQLVAQYEGRRIQFDALCQAITPNTTFKNNTTVMFDNRSGDARYITIGGVEYYFPGYGYKILRISGNASVLPASVSMNCGSAVNVGTILIQN